MIHFIVNPRAGSSRGIRTFRKLEPELIRYRMSYDVMFTEYPGHASEEARRLCSLESAPQIAVLGGDGTMHEVLEGIRQGHCAANLPADSAGSEKVPEKTVSGKSSCAGGTSEEEVSAWHPFPESPVTLMFLPCGSGNDFARGLHLTKDPARFARELSLSFMKKADGDSQSPRRTRLRRAHFKPRSYSRDIHSPRRIRLRYGCGHAQGVSQGFFVSGGMGFDSSVTEEISASPLKAFANRLHLSTLAYLLLGIRQIITEPQAPARIVVDDRRQLKTDRLFFLSAHKMHCEGGGFPFAPDADPSSDTLSVCIFYGMSRPACAWALFLSLFGLHRYKRGVALLNCKKVEIFSKTFRSTHTDGEPLGFVNHVCFTAGEGKSIGSKAEKNAFPAHENGQPSHCAEDFKDAAIDFLVTVA